MVTEAVSPDQLVDIDAGTAVASGSLSDVLLRTDRPVVGGAEASAVLRATAIDYDESLVKHALAGDKDADLGSEALARLVQNSVDERLAACVNLVPVTSVYRWEGVTQADEEVLLVVKTSAERVAELEAILADEHPYDVPELVALAPEHVEATYLAWLLSESERQA